MKTPTVNVAVTNVTLPVALDQNLFAHVAVLLKKSNPLPCPRPYIAADNPAAPAPMIIIALLFIRYYSFKKIRIEMSALVEFSMFSFSTNLFR
jgi:hypothetical protein